MLDKLHMLLSILNWKRRGTICKMQMKHINYEISMIILFTISEKTVWAQKLTSNSI
jgi:hypothetical protein